MANKKTADHTKKAYKLYTEKGPSAVYDYANRKGIPYAHCTPCDADVPSQKGACLMCGSATK